ncbi:fimbria/pilus outer membrane usher protein [Hydrogenimonas thermophila]|uniref:fimbria/pilus outer membrane usher protein n=1 Tax=Hydrogenimonas thermophila TaxID=223786 RepID=UPI002936E1D4|nr:fimbria/pilus outer membrane usher protein [Hydrogenimonas thermophila]WOE70500.1 fimbria/pilus outer membrane usher protein [Hydrogenimonas thermophila]WOE73016.1 fimbria/pilus outer membrane usher protein [Hydrogenimonas thermophila]
MLKKALFLLPLCLIADEKILDVFVGSEKIGIRLISDSNSTIIFDEPIKYGSCNSNYLSEIANSYIIEEDKLIIEPKKECLEKKEFSFAQKKDYRFVPSKSLFLNYSIVAKDEISANIGSGLYLKDTLFYLQNSFDSDKSELQNYYILKELDDKYIKIGKVYTSTHSYLINGYSLDGIQIGTNKAINNNIKTFSYELPITSKSVVEIYNNNQLVQRLKLDAGIYNIKDLPLFYTSNNLKIVITDVFGKRKEIKVPFHYSVGILKKNAIEYQLSLGKDQNGNNLLTGYYKRGILGNLTAGLAFDNSNIAFNAAYVNSFGKFGIEGDQVGNLAIDYSYSAPHYSFSFFKLFTNKEDFRTSLSLNLENYGNISLNYHKNGDEFYAFNYSKNFKKFSFSFNGNKNLTNDNYRIQAQLRWNFGFGNRYGSLLGSYSTTNKKSSTRTMNFSLPVTHDKQIGADGSIEQANTTNNYKLYLKGQYRNEFWLNLQKQSNTTTKEIGVSGSIGCVYGESLECALGKTIYPSESFLIEDEKIKRVPAYWTTDAKSKFASQKVTLRSGQGYKVDTNQFKSITGIIFLDGKPYSERTFGFKGERYFTGIDGSFWVESFKGNISEFKPEIANAECSVSENMNIDEGLQEINFKCRSK